MRKTVLKKYTLSAPRTLREGFTTGTAASAAALAALRYYLTGTAPKSVLCPLPPITLDETGQKARATKTIAIAKVFTGLPSCYGENPFFPFPTALVIKDGGDDPDVTDKAAILATLFLQRSTQDPKACAFFQSMLASFPQAPASPFCPTITIRGGIGVGTATLPGLPIAVGEAAINPAPAAQLRFALLSFWHKQTQSPLPPMTVLITVPEGAKIAQKTFNPRLGIEGGISILGTQGTVRPYSNEAFVATIYAAMEQAHALGVEELFLTTGRRSERLLQSAYPKASPHAFIQIADFCAASLEKAHSLGFKSLVFGCFFGKLLKLASGYTNTHAAEGTIDFTAFASFCAKRGIEHTATIASAKTANHVLSLLLDHPEGKLVLEDTIHQAEEVASRFAKQHVHIRLFHLDGYELCPKDIKSPGRFTS